MPPPECKNPLADRIIAFLTGLGLEVRRAPVTDHAFLPGIRIARGVLVVDEARLAYCGDLLHEAGHLAILTWEQRNAAGPEMGDDGANEMAAIAWSYAAAVHLGIDPAVVFHAHGYRGGAQAILENFKGRRYIGVPVLEWMGMTADTPRAQSLGVAPYPHMLRWLRE